MIKSEKTNKGITYQGDWHAFWIFWIFFIQETTLNKSSFLQYYLRPFEVLMNIQTSIWTVNRNDNIFLHSVWYNKVQQEVQADGHYYSDTE